MWRHVARPCSDAAILARVPGGTKPSRRARVLVAVCLACAVGLVLASSGRADERANERVSFLSVSADGETRDADRSLRQYLEREAGVRFGADVLEYRQVIERLVAWDPADGVIVARTTPYVQVAAELLGAELEVLATYVSESTGSTTYHSYYVARKDELHPNPTPADVIAFISGSKERVRFRYHNLFSTSSFFLPSLHFRDNGVFHMRASTQSLVAIDAARLETDSSSDLVRAVAAGADGYIFGVLYFK